jgi:hypothetical protein
MTAHLEAARPGLIPFAGPAREPRGDVARQRSTSQPELGVTRDRIGPGVDLDSERTPGQAFDAPSRHGSEIDRPAASVRERSTLDDQHAAGPADAEGDREDKKSLVNGDDQEGWGALLRNRTVDLLLTIHGRSLPRPTRTFCARPFPTCPDCPPRPRLSVQEAGPRSSCDAGAGDG